LRPIERRAAVHAALGEPVRLAIVDRLVPGDASPGELAEENGLGNNLLAHHLKVLQDAGVIRRVRSEGDRRRGYVQLCLDDQTVWAAAQAGSHGRPAPMDKAPRVVFVCTANSARSQLAASQWNAISAVPAASAGTHPAERVHPRAVSTGRRHGLWLGRAKPVAIEYVLREGDLVVAVCDTVHEELGTDRPRLHWCIPDPARLDTDEAFETAFADITHRIDRLAASINVPVPAP
jgi:ArsR family transcriptional regulator, arsenate/arsenite/antimonite-responsive transcriptional repressor / arsenate reductase (thioredoxin)